MRARLLAQTLAAAAMLLVFGTVGAHAATYVNNLTTGYYNSGIGTSLDGTNPGPPQLFPLANGASGDPTFMITAPAPDLASAAGALTGG